MRSKTIFYALLLALIIAAALGLNSAYAPQGHSIEPKLANVVEITSEAEQDETYVAQPNQPIQERSLNEKLKHIEGLLVASRYAAAKDFVNDHYSELSSDDLSTIKRLYQIAAQELYRVHKRSELVHLYHSEALIFDDLDSWAKLATSAAEIENWQLAFEALLKASLLESDGSILPKLQRKLVIVAANYRTQMERQGDLLGVHKIYDALYKAHPGFGRFQLELAYSYLRLEQPENARPLLAQLQYDLELGAIARSTLAKLNRPAHSQQPSSSDSSNAVVVPLINIGTSSLINVYVNRQQVSLLLDTGASISALDNRLIEQLNLTPTGKIIQLNTANGAVQAQLYQTNNIRLGKFVLSDRVVASIDLGPNRQFSGLLGTDVLNAITGYNYVIDGSKQALVFKPF